MKEKASSLYVHIPFCQKKCLYCDFVSYTDCAAQYQDDYLDALLRELTVKKEHLEEPLKTLYIGGGTPTVLGKGKLERLMQQLLEKLELCDGAEITVEANPGTLSKERMSNLHSIGVNRVSLGVQSLSDKELKELGRIHSAREAMEALENLIDVGFSVSADLMCNTPGQTAESFEQSLSTLLALSINHLSIYDLKIERNTPFHQLNEKGKLDLPPEAEMEAIEVVKHRFIEKSRLMRYEISNYARPGYHSRHNTVYWKNRPYVGIGVAAASRYGNVRTVNDASLDEYIAADFTDHLLNVSSETISEKMEREETVFLALRLTEGLNLSEFEKRHGAAFQFFYKKEAAEIVEMGLGVFEEGYFRLTNKGLDYSNHVLSLFV